VTRYLVRLANDEAYTPKDINSMQAMIRELLGSSEKIGNLRISTTAIEFDLFGNQADLDTSKSLLESRISKIVTLRSLEANLPNRGENETLREGIDLFNHERFWEAHEVLEEIWHPATGVDRDLIQGLILTAAAFVHYQKNEEEICLSILGRARNKLGLLDHFKNLDIKRLRENIGQILEEKIPRLVRIEWVKPKTHAGVL
jgi:uncharacterized protein